MLILIVYMEISRALLLFWNIASLTENARGCGHLGPGGVNQQPEADQRG